MPESPLPRLVIVADPPVALTELCGVSLLERLRRIARQIGFREGIVLTNSVALLRQHFAAQTWHNRDVALKFVEPPGREVVVSDILNCTTHHESQILIVFGNFYYDERLLRVLAQAQIDSVLTDPSPPPEVAPLWEGSDSSGGGAALLSREWLSRENPTDNFLQSIASAARDGRIASVDAGQEPGYVRSMRRDLRPLFFPAPSPEHLSLAKGLLLDATQKGALDFPALVHAPIEKFLASHLCRVSVTPNQLTLATATLGLCITALYASGHLWAGLLLALAVGVLDGVDGKLARLKTQTTKLGKGEHILDYFVELSWWAALAWHFRVTGQIPYAFVLLLMLFASDLLDRLGRALIEPRLRRSLDDIASFDRFVRYVAGRRNIYTWLFGAFLLMGMPARGFVVFCWWGAASAAIHVFRALQIRLGPAFPR